MHGQGSAGTFPCPAICRLWGAVCGGGAILSAHSVSQAAPLEASSIHITVNQTRHIASFKLCIPVDHA